jgi:coenzyme F420-0:L-glutamate ligase
MQLLPLKSNRLKEKFDLPKSIEESLRAAREKLRDGDILVITSKVVALAQGRVAILKNEKEWVTLIEEESDQVFEKGSMRLTLKNKILIPNAGADRSNAPEGRAILWPVNSFGVARCMRELFKKKYKLRRFGIVIADSTIQPLRQGTTGIAISWDGFEGVHDVRGKKDLYGKKMMYTTVATADNLASAASLEMGETNASIPYVIVRGAKVLWTNKKASSKDYFMPPEKDLFGPFFMIK